jgi:hypothetical protein
MVNQAEDPTAPMAPKVPSAANGLPSDGAPPPLTPAPPVIANPPPKLDGKSSPWRKPATILLSLFLGFFLASGLVSVLDDSCVLLLGNQLFTAISGILTLITLLVTTLVYGLVGLTPVIPKRIVLPVVFLTGLSLLLTLPVAIYGYQWLLQYDLIVSCGVVVLGLGIVRWLQGNWKFRWPLVPEKHLGTRAFSWSNLSVFLLLNIFVLLPGVVVYLGGCAGLAVNHFTEGFVSLRPGGIVMQARRYARDDGKTILLFPMSHIAESGFYRSVAQSVSTNSVVLLEGVTDTGNLLTHGLSYKRAAKSLHLAEQHEDFNLNQGELVRADVDVSEFSSNTIALLNLVALVHAEGLNAHTLSLLLGYDPSPEAEEQLLNDLLLNRNQHLLKVLRARLSDSNSFIIPWGAAHMAGLAREIQKSGFHLVETRDFVALDGFSARENPTDYRR